MTLAEKASSLGLPHYIVHDAGKTQVRDHTTRIFYGVRGEGQYNLEIELDLLIYKSMNSASLNIEKYKKPV